AKLPEICLGLPQAREVKTWRPTCRRSRVTKRRGAKARRQCRQGIWKCIRLSRTNREISGGTADSGTETEEARSMASRPSRDSPGQYLRIRIVGMSTTAMRGAESLGFEISWLIADARLGSTALTASKRQHTR